MNMLIVEDDPRISSFLVKGLSAEGWSTEVASDAAQAMDAIRTIGDDLDFVLLDLGLPLGSGQDVLRAIRQRSATLPVVIVTARTEVADKVSGLDLGANDYITKPFAFEELLARIRAARRTTEQPSSTELSVGDLRLDLMTRIAWRAGRRIELSPREWALLELFMRHPTHVISRARILSQVWQYPHDPGSNVVDVYVGYLRRKLNRPGLDPLVQTVRGTGYRLLS
jgi:DNA-binding response OmpR family regulator